MSLLRVRTVEKYSNCMEVYMYRVVVLQHKIESTFCEFTMNVQSNLQLLSGHCLSGMSLIYCMPTCTSSRSSFSSVFLLCPIKVGEGNDHRNRGKFQALVVSSQP